MAVFDVLHKNAKERQCVANKLEETVWKRIILHPTFSNQFLSEQVLKY